MVECLAALGQQGRRLAVLSNGSDEQQRRKLAMIGVADSSPDVFTAESLGVGKPYGEAYDRTARALGIRASECLNIGDDDGLDVLAARAAGWSGIHLDRSGQQREADALVTLTHVSALLA